jgi:hypothetical protein
MTCFTHTPQRPHGLRSYPLYSSDSERSRGKTLVFPRPRQFLVPKLSCQINFCKMTNFHLTLLSKIFLKLCMFLLLCLGTILAPTCPASYQPSCSPPPSSGSIGVAWFHPFSRSMTAHSPRSFTIRVGSQDEVVAISRLKAYMAVERHAWQSADRRARVQVVLLQPSGSRFQTRWFLHFLLLRHHHETVLEPFSYLARRFLHAWDRWHLYTLHRPGNRPVNWHHPRG